MHSQFSLLTKRRFLPLFITQFLGAFNDNFYKNSLAVLVVYFLTSISPTHSTMLVALAGGLLILPMLLFSAQAGTLADKYEKAKLIRIIKLAEVIIMVLGAFAFMTKNLYLLMGIIFLLGMQMTFFGPLKYSILPAQLKKDELIGGNALIEMGTFVAILLGYILSVVFINLPHGILIVSASIVTIALLGYLSSFAIPESPPPSPELKLSLNFVKESINIINLSRKATNPFLCIMGISWFWLLGFTFLTLFPNYAKDIIHGNDQIYVFFLATFSIGIALGSSFCNRILKGRIEATFVPLAALGMSLFMLDLFYSTIHEMNLLHTADLITPKQYLESFNHWRILFDLFMIAICGGIYIVPLYTILQYETDEKFKARIIACNNIMNALFMIVAAIATAGMLKLKFTLPQIFLTLAIMNVAVIVYSCKLLPGALVKSILRTILHFMYDVEVKGIENFNNAGDRIVISPNHTSFIDGVLLAAFLPQKISFAIYNGYTTKWWMRIVTLFANIYGIDPTNPYSLKSIIKYVKEGNKIVIFPEGRITVTGALMKIYEGPGMIADKADAVILPVLIDGAQYTPFSRLKGKVRLRWFPKITLTIFKPERINIDPNLSPRKRRQQISESLYKIMSDILFWGNTIDVTLFQSLLDAKNIHGGSRKVIEDIRREPLSYQKLIIGSIIIGKKLEKLTAKGEAVGVLLPNLNATAVTLFGLNAVHRVAALINFSTGVQNVVMACHTAKIKLICTSKAFITSAKLQPMINALENDQFKIIYLEDLKDTVTLFNKLHGLIASYFPRLFRLIPTPKQAEKAAVILFTSGSEGTPKAVVLSNRNIQANKTQLSSRIDFSPTDTVLNALPMFHSFGLTAGTIIPILYGMKVFFYPSPLHYRVIPELSYDLNATILFGTNTFLAGYAKYGKPYDFYSIRYVYAGAEKLKEENRRLWADKFGVRIFEGYGTTETSPIISANTPMHNRLGTVGKVVPGLECRLDPVPDLPDGGRLFVKGPNVMLGYMLYNNPGVIIPPPEGWYDTGDIVTFDEDGYIAIQGRAKRFSKIAGEMISLIFVENYIDKLWPDAQHAVIAVPDEKKGEQLVLFTTMQEAEISEILLHVRAYGISELAVPKMIRIIEAIPLLGSGKTDYMTLQRMI
jgi:acyl-[acyl-carrier-protein]-phospholipid O-acyltransferase / long-chain-fatty-acid--[acyl-carrier-protein] ligase